MEGGAVPSERNTPTDTPVTFEVTVTQYEGGAVPTEEDMRQATIHGLIRFGFSDLAGVSVENKN